jgi:hypothetical protein
MHVLIARLYVQCYDFSMRNFIGARSAMCSSICSIP